MTQHVVPIDDLEPHETTGSQCKCSPRVDVLESGDLLVVHNSFDGREIAERLIDEVNEK